MAVVIPETVTVHLGRPGSPAENVTVPFADYIKNVASSEIYPTWPEEAIRANVLAEISFTLNRIYTEYYRSRGYDYDITNSTASDQAFVYGRDVFDTVSRVVDGALGDYLVREGQALPLFAQYCDGRITTCAGLSQWGTVPLAEEGLDALAILRRYYGEDVVLVEDAPVGSVAESYPGVPLRPGSGFEDVRALQYRLDRIAQNYPSIPRIPSFDGVYGPETEAAVRAFQRIFDLTPDGVVGRATWYRIINVYGGVKRLSELESEGLTEEEVRRYFTAERRAGDTGVGVGAVQYLLDVIGSFDPELIRPEVDLIFGRQTETAVKEFQRKYGLPVTGAVDRRTWNEMVAVYRALLGSVPEESYLFPGKYLSRGMRGAEIEELQTLLRLAAENDPSIPAVERDGIFGPATEAAVRAAQETASLPVTGYVGPLTWDALVTLAGVK